MTIFNVFIMALIQGMAELLPVSSSAHVILAQHWLGLDPSAPEMVFLLVCLHTGTMGAVLIYFRRRWVYLLKQSLRDLAEKVFIACIGTAILGLTLKKFVEEIILGGSNAEVEDLFKSRPAVATALLAAGLLIFVTGRLFATTEHQQEKQSSLNASGLTRGAAFFIGLIQGLCLPFRGFSRSGATISAAMIMKVNRHLAEDFSFILAVLITPPVILRSLLKLRKAALIQGIPFSETLSQTLPYGALGAVFAFLSGLLALRFLSRFLESGKWWVFGVYCIFISVVMYSGI